MYFNIALAGVSIGVQSLHDEVYRLCADYLTDSEPSFTVSVTDADIAFERMKSDREARFEGRVPEDFSDDYLETLAVYRKIAVELLRFDTLLLHGSVVAVDGCGYLFTAPSGVGKTTHTRLWLDHIPGASIVNGDKPLLRFTSDGVEACGTPWAGKEGLNANTVVPLRAICVLTRGAVNRIAPLSFLEAYPTLLQQSYRPADPEALRRTMELVRALGERVALYRLACNMEGEAARVAYEGMRGRGVGQER